MEHVLTEEEQQQAERAALAWTLMWQRAWGRHALKALAAGNRYLRHCERSEMLSAAKTCGVFDQQCHIRDRACLRAGRARLRLEILTSKIDWGR